MKNDALYILHDDKEAARIRIAELEQTIQDLGPEFYEVFNQSSETWHDNAPFDALRDRQAVLYAELQNLKAVLSNAAVSIPKQNRNIVGIGAHVTTTNQKTHASHPYFIAGSWTIRTGQKHGDATVMSTGAPLAQVLLGKKVGDTATFRQHTLTIDSIEFRQ